MTARGLLRDLYSRDLRPNQVVWKDLRNGRYHIGNQDEDLRFGHQWMGTVYFLRLQDQSLVPKNSTYERFLSDASAG